MDHEINVTRPRMKNLMKNVYIPKMKAKAVVPFMYSTKTQTISTKNHLFDIKNRSKDKAVLGVGTGHVAQVCVMNSFGHILHQNAVSDQPDLLSLKFDGSKDESEAIRHINQFLPKVFEDAFSTH